MKWVTAFLFLATGVVNLVPLTGVLSAARLRDLYGVELTNPNIVILMRHRAVFFGMIGCLLVAAAFDDRLRGNSVILGVGSMASFVAVAKLVGECNAQLRRVVLADYIGLAMLLAAFLLDRFARAGVSLVE